jgi:NAD-specific glutamate dehydrogenase
MRENREVPRSPAVSIDASSWMVRGVVVRHRRVARGTLRR